MTELIINKQDFKDYIKLSKAMSLDKIEPFIRMAQDTDMKEAFCNDFFYDILNRFQEDDYQKLIHGDTYSVTVGAETVTKKNPGLKAVLCHWAYSRYSLEGHVVNTAFSQVQKTNNFSEPISQKSKERIHDEHRRIAGSYLEEVKRYIDDKQTNDSIFALYRVCHGCDDTGSGGLNIDVI